MELTHLFRHHHPTKTDLLGLQYWHGSRWVLLISRWQMAGKFIIGRMVVPCTLGIGAPYTPYCYLVVCSILIQLRLVSYVSSSQLFLKKMATLTTSYIETYVGNSCCGGKA